MKMGQFSTEHVPDFSLYVILSVDNQSSYYQEADHMEAENKALVQHFIEEVWNKGNIDLIDQRVSDSYAGYDPSMPAPINGNEGFKQLVVGFRHAFPDLRLDVEDLVAEGDKVVGRYMLHGTQTGEFLGLPPSGKEVSVTGIFIRRIAGGKYVEGWDLTDALGMMQQLGVIPMPGQSATKPGS